MPQSVRTCPPALLYSALLPDHLWRAGENEAEEESSPTEPQTTAVSRPPETAATRLRA
jgi:hypothetical protein